VLAFRREIGSVSLLFFARQDYEKNKDFGMMMGIKPDKRRIL
jgi:hypothetical protein